MGHDFISILDLSPAGSQPLGVRDPQAGVIMVREEHKPADFDRVEPLSPA